MRSASAALIFLSAACLPLRGSVDGYTKVKTAGGITEYRMEANGLTVLLAPMPESPAATFSITYRVGSRDESYGSTGAAHLLEHLMFKGTAASNKEAGNGLDQILEGIGADTNATTSWDRTNYSTTLPAEHLPLIIGMEADRMRNLRLREEDFRPEMRVVMDEFFLAEDDPVSALDREIWATAFHAHPYRHAVLGWRADVENVPLAKLREFYDTYYWPDNATVTIAGGYGEDDAVLQELKRHYGSLTRAPRPIPAVHGPEPVQTGLRRFEMKRAVEAGVVTIAFKSPETRHPDFPALQVLCDILADGQNSYFYNDLTSAGLALDVTAEPQSTLDPSLLLITAELSASSTHEKTEDGILDILAEVIEDGVEEADVRTAITRLSAQARYDRDGSQAMADVLTESIAAGDWTLYQSREDALKKVTAADVQRDAKQWLREDRCTIGWLVPDKETPVDEPAPGAPLAAAEVLPLSLPVVPPAAASASAKISARVNRSQTAGLDLVVCPSGHSGVVHLSGSLPAGTAADQAIASFVAAMIERGTTQHDATKIGELLDETGSTLEFGIRDGFLHFSGRCFSDQLPRLVAVLAEQLRDPVFPQKEIGPIREQLLSETILTRTNADEQAALAFNHALYPAGHPARRPDGDEIAARVKAIRREDLVSFHQKWFGPASALIVVTGDVEAGPCRQLVEKSFRGWAGGQAVPHAAAPAELSGPLSLRVPLPGKESVRVLLGQPCSLSPGDTDALAVSLASAALGDGFTSRLGHTVRDTEGLTYGVGSSLFFKANGDATWLVSASFAPDLLDRGVGSIRREVEKWLRDGLGETEFSYRRSAMTGASRVALATSEGLAAALHDCVRHGFPPDWLDGYPERIASLTREAVNSAIRKHLSMDRMVEVKCGDVP